MKTNLGEINFSESAPSMEEIVKVAKKYVGFGLDYRVLGPQTYLVVFDGDPRWGAILMTGKKFLRITDQGGTIEGPAVAQSLLYIAKKLGGDGPDNDPNIQFPLTENTLKEYEEKYLKVRSSVPREMKNCGVSVLLGLMFLAFVLWLVFR